MTKLPTIEEAIKIIKDYHYVFGKTQTLDSKAIKTLNKNVDDYDGDFTKLALEPLRKVND